MTPPDITKPLAILFDKNNNLNSETHQLPLQVENIGNIYYFSSIVSVFANLAYGKIRDRFISCYKNHGIVTECVICAFGKVMLSYYEHQQKQLQTLFVQSVKQDIRRFKEIFHIKDNNSSNEFSFIDAHESLLALTLY